MNIINLSLLLLALSWALVGIYKVHATQKGLLDSPNSRSSHSVCTATGAGIIMSILWFGYMGYLVRYEGLDWTTLLLFGPAFALSVIGYKDDKKPLSAKFRFICQCLAVLFSLAILGFKHFIMSMPFSFIPDYAPLILVGLLMVWVINLVNFMDGIDGFAGQQAVFFFGMMAYFFYHSHAFTLFMLCGGLAIIVSGYLIWNWPTARIFMGDSGSTFLGFLIALFPILAQVVYGVPIILSVMLMSIFWLDASLTLLRRVLAGEKWNKPHKKHAYQRLIQAGWSHQQVVTGALVLNSVLSLLAYWGFHHPHKLMPTFGFALCLIGGVYLLVEIKRPMYKTWFTTKTLDESG